jgi:broad specificity phosphatase PhoE
MERALLTRHAESEFSVRGLTNGDPGVACGLTAEGRLQAQRLGELLAAVPIDLCVTTAFERTQETAGIALAGRDVPRRVLPGLNDIRFGQFEGGPLRDYRAWAHTHGPTDEVPGGGESRVETVRRYVQSYQTILERPEPSILVVAHGLTVRYALDAAEGRPPAPAVEQIPYAEPFRLQAAELGKAVELLEAWTRSPTWHGRN